MATRGNTLFYPRKIKFRVGMAVLNCKSVRSYERIIATVEIQAPKNDLRHENKWVTASSGANRKLRLFCLPYAGGGASIFKNWQKLVPAELEICPLRLPGREMRIREEPIVHQKTMVDSIIAALSSFLTQPYALFGHSMGGLLAYEVAWELRARKLPLPEHLFFSATPGPQIPRNVLSKPVVELTDAEFFHEISSVVNSSIRDLASEPELLSLMLPVLRSDFQLLEAYAYVPRESLPIPITVLGGASDPTVSEADLRLWSGATSADFSLEILEGDHFFLNQPGPVVEIVVARLETLLSGLPFLR